jgi:hypothetical protein
MKSRGRGGVEDGEGKEGERQNDCCGPLTRISTTTTTHLDQFPTTIPPEPRPGKAGPKPHTERLAQHDVGQ